MAGDVIGPDDDPAAVAGVYGVGPDHGVGADVSALRVLHRGVVALVVAADQHRAAAGGARGVDRGVAGDAGIPPEHLHAAALAGAAGGVDVAGDQRRAGLRLQGDLAAARAAGVEAAAGGDVAAIADEVDRAVPFDGAAGADHAGVVDHGAGQVAGDRGRHHHAAALGVQFAAVGDAGEFGDGFFVDREADQAVALHVERDLRAGGERHGAEPRLDHAAIGGVVAGEHDVAAVAGADQAFIDDRGAGRRAGIAAEDVAPGEEIVVADVQRGGDQAADVEARRGTEEDALRIDQEHAAVGRQAAEDRRGIAADDAVEHHRAAAGLHELHAVALADREALPVDDGLVAALGDELLRGRGIVDGGAAADDAAAGGQLLGLRRQAGQQHAAEADGGQCRGHRRQLQAARQASGEAAWCSVGSHGWFAFTSGP